MAQVRGTGLVQWSTEQWQFFAFIFAALVALALTLVEELPRIAWLPKWPLKVGAFLLLGWLTLYCRSTKRLIIRALPLVKR